MFGLGTGEILVVLVIGLFLFGRRLPELARFLGKSYVAVRREAGSIAEELNAVGKTIR